MPALVPESTAAAAVHSDQSEQVVDLDGVRFSWHDAPPWVIDIEALRVSRGERVFLRGPSGSGKSTLLSLVAGVATAREGTVQVLGRNLGALGGAERDRFRADHIGFIFQMFNRIPYLSVVENVVLPCGFSQRRRTHRQGYRGGGGASVKHLDIGADLLRRQVTDLSVGQQQRVAAARTRSAPENSSSPMNRRPLVGSSRGISICCSANATGTLALIFVSHDASLAPLFDRTLEFS
jgi:putative ABC transport system ATP-binding protein